MCPLARIAINSWNVSILFGEHFSDIHVTQEPVHMDLFLCVLHLMYTRRLCTYFLIFMLIAVTCVYDNKERVHTYVLTLVCVYDVYLSYENVTIHVSFNTYICIYDTKMWLYMWVNTYICIYDTKMWLYMWDNTYICIYDTKMWLYMWDNTYLCIYDMKKPVDTYEYNKEIYNDKYLR